MIVISQKAGAFIVSIIDTNSVMEAIETVKDTLDFGVEIQEVRKGNGKNVYIKDANGEDISISYLLEN